MRPGQDEYWTRPFQSLSAHSAPLPWIQGYVLKGFKIVPQSETRVVERLGRYDRTLQSGINYLLPIIDRAREVVVRDEIKYADGSKSVVMRTTSRIDLREQVYDFDKQSVITKDNVTTTINALLYFQIVDPVKSVYEIDNLPNAIEKLTQTTPGLPVGGDLEYADKLTLSRSFRGRVSL